MTSPSSRDLRGDTPPHNDSPRRVAAPLRDFLNTEAAGGTLILVATVAALMWANSPFKDAYHSLWGTKAQLNLWGMSGGMDLHHFINDALMALFFFVVGLEIKREMTTGHLSSSRARRLPLVAALAGMLVPAGIYLAVAGRTASHGWGVPMATDIALAIGLVSVLGARVPPSMRAFLLGLAVIDDIGAIIVIALFYSSDVSLVWVVSGMITVGLVVAASRLGVNNLTAYVLLGVTLWACLHRAGVHPTLAGVTIGLLVPSTLPRFERIEHVTHTATSTVIVPLFALANAGLELSFDAFGNAWRSPVAWGVFAGLVIGKPAGILLATRLAARTGIAELPQGVGTATITGIGNAAGIGFTVALFINQLAFTDPSLAAESQIAILLASVVSAAVGALVLSRAATR